MTTLTLEKARQQAPPPARYGNFRLSIGEFGRAAAKSVTDEKNVQIIYATRLVDKYEMLVEFFNCLIV